MFTIFEEMINKTYTIVKVYDYDNLPELLIDTFVNSGFHPEKILTFISNEEIVAFFHVQECCELVDIKEIVGELSDLENSPILEAEEVREHKEDTEFDSETWTFYKFRTAKGSVTVTWIGSSNGYYSETVQMEVFKI